MRLTSLILAGLFALSGAQIVDTETYLNITTLGAHNNVSTIECWQIGPMFTSANRTRQAGLTLNMGLVENATFTIKSPRSEGRWHAAPWVQYVFVLSLNPFLQVFDNEKEKKVEANQGW